MNQQNPWEDAHALSGAYAVDALDADERARFEAHLEQCHHCRTEVDELREAAAFLADDEVTPPPSVRSAVLAGITTIRPLPPVDPTVHAADEDPAPAASVAPLTPVRTAQLPTDTSDTRDTSFGDDTSDPGSPDTTDPDGTRAVPADAPVAPVTDLSARRRLRMLRAPLLVAATFVVLLGAGIAWLAPWSGDDKSSEVHLTASERVLAADDAVRVEREFPDGSRASIVLSRAEGRAVILTERMAPAPNGKVYALWLQTPAGDMEPAGLMPDESDATVLLDGDASEATAIGITVEPDGGSPVPTSDPIAVFPLEA